MAHTRSGQERFRKNEDMERHANATDDMEAQTKRLISQSDMLVDGGEHLDSEELKRIANELIKIYDNPWNGHEIRDNAFHAVSSLAKHYDLVLEVVINNARSYIETQYIDDASPYSPNSFDVLSEIGRANPGLISFLKNTIENEWGIPRWEAMRALCSLDDPQADVIINNLIQGRYPARFLDLQIDLDKIRKLRHLR